MDAVHCRNEGGAWPLGVRARGGLLMRGDVEYETLGLICLAAPSRSVHLQDDSAAYHRRVR